MTPETPSPELLNEKKIRHAMGLSTLEGGFATVFINWTQGSVLTGYALHLGATPFELGLISSVPLLGQVLSPVVAWLGGRAGRRKPIVIACAIIGRLIWLLAPFLVLLPNNQRAPLLIAVIALSSIFQAGGGALWIAWMGDLVPPRERGRYFGFRAGIHGMVGMAANLAAGLLLDQLGSPIDFQVVIVTAVASALIAAWILTKQIEPPVLAQRLHFLETFTLPLKNQNFRHVLAFNIYWTFAVLLAAPFVIPYFLEYLRMSYTQVALWSAIAAISGLILAPQWGRLADRAGNKPILQIATIGAGTLLPACWMLGNPGNLWPVWFGGVIDAMVWGAIGPAQFNLALASAPKEHRSSFIAVLSATTGLAGFIGGFLSGPLLEVFSSLAPRTGTGWTGYHTLFALSGLMRSFAWLWLRRVHEDGAIRVRELFTWSRWV
jgi:MFS family permease